MTKIKRRTITGLYKEAINQCCNPDCESGNGYELHHIVPLCIGGLDTYINYIVLCTECHNHLKLHARHNQLDIQEMQLRWKFYREILDLGGTSDDLTENEFRALLRATIKART